MKQATEPVFFDHYLASAFGEWFAKANFPLSYDVFLNLLTSGPVVCSRLDFFFYTAKEDPFLERSSRRKELDALINTGKLILIDLDHFSVGVLEKDGKYSRVLDKARQMQSSEYRSIRHRAASLANVGNLAYCQSNKVPFRVSQESAAPVLTVAADFLKEGIIYSTFGEKDPMGLNSILKWVFQVEVPALDARTEKFVSSLIELQTQTYTTDEERARAEAFLRKQYYNERVFLSAEELLALLKEKDALAVLQEFLTQAATHKPTAVGTRELVRQEWDKLLGRLTISEWAFTGVNVATSPLPFSGAATAVAQAGVNRYIRQRSNWLLTLNEFNKRIREPRVGERDRNN